MTNRSAESLHIARGFSLPLNAVTEVIAVLATRGAGKSFGSADVLEELHAASLQFVVIDPMGVYWGLRSSHDGKKAGLKIILLGGEQGDVPLEPTSGKLIADVVVDSGQSFVLDLSLFDSKAEQVRFMEAFCERLFYRKGPIEKRTPLMLVVDEADEFAPQRPEKNETKMLSHMIRLAKRGRTRGIGLMTLTQRAAEFSKAILNLSSAVVFMRTAGPHDRREIKKWMAGSAPDLLALVDERFPRLDTGHALVYSPHWLKLEQPREIKFRMIRTFDSYKTPEAGEILVAPQAVAHIDLEALGAEIAATVERAKENDPTELRARVRTLERQLAERPTIAPEPIEIPVKIEVPIFTDEDREQLRSIAQTLAEIPHAMLPIHEKVLDLAARAAAKQAAPPPPLVMTPRQGVMRKQPVSIRPDRPLGRPANAAEGMQQKILDSLAWFEAMRIATPSRIQVGFMAGYKVGKKGGGSFATMLHQMKDEGLIDYPNRGEMQLTAAGREMARDPGLPQENEALHDAVLGRFDGPEAKLLRVLIDLYPGSISRIDLGTATGYTVTAKGGGSFATMLSQLHSLGLIHYPQRGQVAALNVLFPLG